MLSNENLEILFTKARSHKSWLDKEVTDNQINQIYNLLKFAPTSGNCCPARFTFIKSDRAKERLIPTLDKGNIDKSMHAPYVVIISYDTQFYDSLSILSPHNDAKAGLCRKRSTK
jgi:nitroreductase